MSTHLLFRDQSLENFEKVVSYIDEPADLLSLALVSKSIYNVLVPAHLEFFAIRCDPYRKDVWDALAEKPTLTRRIRRLELVSEMGPGAPPTIITPRTLGFDPNDFEEALEWDYEPWVEAQTSLLKAIKLMPHLTRFVWRIAEPRGGTRLDPIFDVIKYSCPEFKELEIDYPSHMVTARFSKASFGNSIWKLTNLTRFSLSVPQAADGHYARQMENMLIKKCPHLEDLRIIIGEQGGISDAPESDDEDDEENGNEEEGGNQEAFPLNRILSEGNWPHLKRLTLGGDSNVFVDDKEIGATLSSFTICHPNLEAIRLDFSDEEDPYIFTPKDSTLPHLRSLCLLGKSSRIDIRPVAHFIQHLVIDASQRPETTYRVMELLKTLVVKQFSAPKLQVLLSLVPNIESLAILETDVNPTSKELVFSLSKCSKLKRVTGIFGNKYNLDKGFPIEISTLLNSVKSVEYLSLPVSEYGQTEEKWFLVQRDKNGGCTGLKKIKDTDGCDWQDWGRFFDRIGPKIEVNFADEDYY